METQNFKKKDSNSKKGILLLSSFILIGLIVLVSAIESVEFITPTPVNKSSVQNPVGINISSNYGGENHYTLLDLDKSLLAWYRYEDDPGIRNDSSSYDNYLIDDSGLIININDSAIYGQAIEYNVAGTDAGMDSAYNVTLREDIGWTIGFWALPVTGIGENEQIIGIGGTSLIVGLDFNADDCSGLTDVYQLWYNSKALEICTEIDLGDLHHLVFVWNGTGALSYMDGVFRNYKSWTGANVTGKILVGETTTIEYDGWLDEVVVFNRSLSAGEVKFLYNATSATINLGTNYQSFNLSIGDHTINAGAVSGDGNLSKEYREFTVLTTPGIFSLVLNTTSSNNYSTEDLNGWATVVPSDSKIIYYWKLFGITNISLIMPFEYGSNDTFTPDYIYYNYPVYLHGVVNDNVTYNSTGGFDGHGAYEFKGINGGITLGGVLDEEVGLKSDMTFMAWGKYNNLSGDMNLVTYAGPGESYDDNYLYQLELTDNKKLIYMHESHAGSNHAFTSTVAADVDIGEWHHYAFVRDDSADSIKFYVDGVQLGDAGSFSYDPEGGDDSLFYLGKDVGGEYWNGTLDDVYIYNKVFTEGEIEKYYLNQTNILDKTMTSIDDNWTICGIPMNDEFGVGDTVCSNVLKVKEGPPVIENISVTDEIFIGENVTFNVSIYNETAIDSVWIKIWESVIEGAVKFIGYLENIIDDVWTIIVPTNSSFNESEYNYTIYANTTSGLESNESGSFNISKTIIDSVILNSTLGTNLTTENLTAYVINLSSGYKTFYDWRKDENSIAVLNMPFDGGLLAENETKIKDYSSFTNNGTVSGAVYNSTGGRNSTGAYEFNGVNDSIEIDYNQDFNFTDGEGFTVMTWMSPNDLVNNRGDIISHYRGDVNYRVWDLQIYDGQARFAGCYNGTLDSCVYAYSGVDVNESNTWYHLAGSWNGTHLQVYVNGIAEDNTPPALENIHSTDNRGIRLGTDTATEWYNGTIDDVLIFNKSLSAQQILAIYNNRTDLIVSNETSIGENWSVQVTPNNGTEDGQSVMSNNLIIRTEDTCTCPSSPTAWTVNMEDNCWLNSMCNISGYDLTFYSSGNFTINSTLYVNEIKNLSNGMIVWMKPNGMIYNG